MDLDGEKCVPAASLRGSLENRSCGRRRIDFTPWSFEENPFRNLFVASVCGTTGLTEFASAKDLVDGLRLSEGILEPVAVRLCALVGRWVLFGVDTSGLLKEEAPDVGRGKLGVDGFKAALCPRRKDGREVWKSCCFRRLAGVVGSATGTLTVVPGFVGEKWTSSGLSSSAFEFVRFKDFLVGVDLAGSARYRDG